MGLLDGGLQATFAAAFGGFYLDGTLYRVGATQEDRDARGRIVVVGEPVTERIKAQVDGVTEAMRQADGYTARDVRLLVLQIGPDGGVVSRPNTDDEIAVGAARYAIDLIDSDPANTYWAMRGTPR